MRNWDYRFCWLRDATLHAARAADAAAITTRRRPGATGCCAPSPATRPRTADHVRHRRRAPAARVRAADWLPGYEGSRPVRVGNAAAEQFQLDVYGEVIDALHLAARCGLRPATGVWSRCSRLCSSTWSRRWQRARRGHLGGARPRRHFTHSKVMAWVAFDRAVRMRRGVRASTARSSAGARCATRSTPRSARGLRPGPRHLHPVLRLRRARRQPAADPAGRLPAAGRPARASARSRRSSASCSSTASSAATTTDGTTRRRPAGGRGRVPRLHLLAGRRPAR